jgi:hypothetical protein
MASGSEINSTVTDCKCLESHASKPINIREIIQDFNKTFLLHEKASGDVELEKLYAVFCLHFNAKLDDSYKNQSKQIAMGPSCKTIKYTCTNKRYLKE